MIEPFLVGVIVMASATAALFFIRFWQDTRDVFFLAFAASFAIEGLSRFAVLFVPRPNEGSPWIYLARLFASLLILIAILKKNYGKDG